MVRYLCVFLHYKMIAINRRATPSQTPPPLWAVPGNKLTLFLEGDKNFQWAQKLGLTGMNSMYSL